MDHPIFMDAQRLQSNIAVISTDTNGMVTVFNQSATDILGYEAQEILGKPAPFKALAEILKFDNSLQHVSIEAELIHKNGNPIPMVVLSSAIKDPNGHIMGILFTATQRIESEQTLTFQELPEETLFSFIFNREIKRTEREEQPLSLLEIALDQFKNDPVNTQIALNKTTNIICQRIQRASDFIARNNQNHFYIVLPNTDRGGATKVAEQLRLLINQTTSHTVSIGILSLFPNKDTDVNDCIKLVTTTLDLAQKAGGNCCRF